MEYLISLIAFIATVIAMKGDTWNNNLTRRLKLTKTGYLALAVTFIGLTVSIIKIQQDLASSFKKDLEFQSLIETSNEAKDSLLVLKSQLETTEKILARISSESERQPQWVMNSILHIPPNQSRTLETKVFSGTYLKPYFYDIEGQLELIYNGQRPKLKNNEEIPIMGNNGQEYTVGIRYRTSNPFVTPCMVKILMLSTPRVRSNRWSYEEESN